MYNPYSLEGKTIMVTGASSGIGRATAIECSKMGAKVIVIGRNKDRLKETCSKIGGGKFIVCDLSDENELNKLVESTPQLQGLVLNAGICKLSPVRTLKMADMKEMLQINTVSTVMLLQKLLKAKKISSPASVVFTSSMAALGKTAVGNAAYSASKGAISSYAKVAALELGKKNIRVNCICPGDVRTPMLEDTNIAKDNEELAFYPLGRYGEPEDIAHAMVFLLSDASCWITGTDMIVDGGLSVG